MEKDFMTRLRTLMERRGITQYGFAKASGIPITTINGWLKGRSRNIRSDNLERITKYFNVHPAWLLYGEEQYTPNLESEAQKLAEDIAAYGDSGIRKARQFLKILEEDKALDIRPLKRYKKAG